MDWWSSQKPGEKVLISISSLLFGMMLIGENLGEEKDTLLLCFGISFFFIGIYGFASILNSRANK